MKNIAKTEHAATAQEAAAPTFTKDQLAASKRYASLRDLVSVLLEDGRQYTLAEVDEKIEKFKKGKVCARCTVFPDLNNAELQDSWGVMKPEELLGAMLIGGEFDDYVTEVFRANGFQTENELVDEAKN